MAFPSLSSLLFHSMKFGKLVATPALVVNLSIPVPYATSFCKNSSKPVYVTSGLFPYHRRLVRKSNSIDDIKTLQSNPPSLFLMVAFPLFTLTSIIIGSLLMPSAPLRSKPCKGKGVLVGAAVA